LLGGKKKEDGNADVGIILLIIQKEGVEKEDVFLQKVIKQKCCINLV